MSCPHDVTEFGHCVGCGEEFPTLEFQQKKQEFEKLLNSEGYWNWKIRTEEQQNQMDALMRWFAERDESGRFIGFEDEN
jgi:hypothetical protein